MRKRDRQRRPARPKSYKDSKPRILIVAEGKVTEREYLEGFAGAAKNPRVRIEVVGGAGVPKTIIESAKDLQRKAEKRARRERDDNLLYDKVWCVFDFDDHPDIQNAMQMARDNGMEFAMSNPCIELWLWLHFAEQPGMQHRHDMQKMMKKHIPNYDKHVDYSDYQAGYDEAVKRATRLEEVAKLDSDEGRNPTTGVWRLTKSIRSGA